MFKTNKTLIKELFSALNERLTLFGAELTALKELNKEYHLVSLNTSDKFTREMEALKAKHEAELLALEAKFKEFFGIRSYEKTQRDPVLFQPGGLLDHLFTSIKQLSYNKEKAAVVHQLLRK